MLNVYKLKSFTLFCPYRAYEIPRMSCVECENTTPKYKCPTCLHPYCSVACCKTHKEKQCKPPEKPNPPPEPEEPTEDYEFPTCDTVPMEKLNLLVQSTSLKECLANPHLRKLLDNLDSHPKPNHLFHELMQEPIFTEFVDECLKVVEPDEETIK